MSTATELPPRDSSHSSKGVQKPKAHLRDTICDAGAAPLLIEIELLLLSFATGIQDAATYPDYRCFASNQTGNAVLLAVGLAGIGGDMFDLPNIGVSLGAFVGGCYVMGQLANLVGPRRRLWVLFSNMVSTAMVYAAAAVQWILIPTHTGTIPLVIISLLAFSSGAQVAMTRPLNVPQITTAMATAAFVDLLIDPRLHAFKNRGRNRRFLFLLMLTTGAFAGAYAYARVGSPFTLLICAAVKTIVTVLVYFNVAESRSCVEGRIEGPHL
ncbi:hypothetical protein CONLIGDRAFT_658085 [Coniochaeta ligniaria NRRL 30616]|uniref:DUF1275 domain protein n=1 Tax=Coniochaeta ligniaria NRRL 30616 TaxID=1408157 RepID=A0A1J7J0I6_9PEZI|nr:hypothetical protein CONLIGDRAFT_658085 [Coniochaeta ligniaria NRRL 30616]